MKQLIQNLKSGEISYAEIPSPGVGKNEVLIKSVYSLLSLGTEKMLINFGKANLVNKALQQPEKVKQVINKIKSEGFVETYQAVKTKLDEPISMGYSNVGEVLQIGENVKSLKVGDKVVSNSPHSEIVLACESLCAKIPEEVKLKEATFTVIGAISLQAARLIQPTLGETGVVIGLGLIGLTTIQVLLNHGCKVICYDFDQEKVNLAKELGAEAFVLSDQVNPVGIVLERTQQQGADFAIIAASTSSNDPIEQAPKMLRKRGRIVLLGVAGLDLSRADFYEKEISFQVSCSYGPGRYENLYESKNFDYPIGFVRWTAKRNFEAILELLKTKKINFNLLISKNIKFDELKDFYSSEKLNRQLGVVVEYDQSKTDSLKKTIVHNDRKGVQHSEKVVAGLIGSGNFTKATLLPILSKEKVKISTIVGKTGFSAEHLAKKYQIEKVSTDLNEVIKSESTNTVFITTRHNTHANLSLNSLVSGKNVFVEKPLALSHKELNSLEEYFSSKQDNILMVGFNRRFAPLVFKMCSLLGEHRLNLTIHMEINAGKIPLDHWLNDTEQGGGRLLGEACHFIDLSRHLANSEIKSYQVTYQDEERQNFVIVLNFKNDSLAVINYYANGSNTCPKEIIKVHHGNKTLVLNNFKELVGHGWDNFKKEKLSKIDKGHTEQIKKFSHAIHTGQSSPIPLNELFEVSKIAIDLSLV